MYQMTIEKMTPAEKANRRLVVLLGVLLATLCFSAVAISEELDLPREQVALVAPPFVHPHEQATNQGPKIVQFSLKVEEKRLVIDDEGTTIQAMTFNGSIPGPMMVVHEGLC
jgi:nitrite reductase (NO-forming)